MKKGVKIAIGVLTVLALYIGVRRFTRKYVPTEQIADGTLYVAFDSTGIQVKNTSTQEILTQYIYSNDAMDFPLEREDLNIVQYFTNYDNVARLQAYLALSNTVGEIAIDGMFGVQTELAVFSEVGGYAAQLTAENPNIYGYTLDGGEDQYKKITVEYYTEVVIPELQEFGMPY
jgi:hypothetical protein